MGERTMITNERQYRITRAQLAKLKEASQAFDLDEAASLAGSRVLARAEYEAIESQIDELAEQVAEYELLSSGAVRILKASSLVELPTVLIKARIAKGLSQRALAESLGLKEQQIQRYEAGDYASASLRRLAEVAEALNLEVREIAELTSDAAETEPDEAKDGLDWSRFPIEEMYKRHWFEDFFSGSLSDAMDSSENLARTFVRRAIPRPVPALLRQHVRSGSTMDRYALLAWQCRVLSLAKKNRLEKTFSEREASEQWLRELVRLSRYKDGPRRAKAYLEAAGIHLAVEPHLQHTHLDGAALLLPRGVPVVALTLRYDRLDNFWFVLVHEVSHVIKDFRSGRREGFFDDLEADPDDVEREADHRASEALIPESVWEMDLARYVRTEESIRDLARELQISPAIIAGRIRKEADNYTILREMVGQGKVREQFPEVKFGQ